MVYCLNCGKKNPKGSKFCMYCGERIEEGKAKIQTPKKREASKKVSTSLPLIFLAIFIIIVSLLLFYIYILNGNIESLSNRVKEVESRVLEQRRTIFTQNFTIQDQQREIEQQTYWASYYKNVTEQQSEEIFNLEGLVSEYEYKIEQQVEEILNLKNKIINLEAQITDLEAQIVNLQSQITSLTYTLNQKLQELEMTEEELGVTKAQLNETQRLLNIAERYEERVKEGIYLSKAYKLLGHYDKIVDTVREVTTINYTKSDEEIWKSASDIYYWLGNNYGYCSDRGFCLENVTNFGGYYTERWCPQIQFFSPDELIYHGSQDVLCGDCDDQAQLFAGMMYASGVPHDSVRVECGYVESGGHCWNGVYVNNRWYRIDPVCASPSVYIPIFGGYHISLTPFSSTYDSVDCFKSYNISSWYNPEGYHS